MAARADRTVLGGIMLAWLGMLVSFLVLVPIFQGPDEPTQVDRI